MRKVTDVASFSAQPRVNFGRLRVLSLICFGSARPEAHAIFCGRRPHIYPRDRVFPDKRNILPLVPPLGEITVASLLDAPNLASHSARARAWAEAVWRAWTPFHGRVHAWADAATVTSRPRRR